MPARYAKIIRMPCGSATRTIRYTAAFGYLYAIADGMGGLAHGGVASTLALSTFYETFYDAADAAVQQKLKIGIQNANLSVYQAAQRMSAGGWEQLLLRQI